MQKSTSRAPARAPAPVSTQVYDALVRLLGRERAEVVDFFVDARLAGDNPERYERAVESLLGEQSGRLVITGLRSELARRSGKLAKTGTDSLLTQVRIVEKSLTRRAHLGVDA
jgi:hypothetical protein